MLAAFEQTRKFTDWMDPNVGNQPYATYIPKFMAGDVGMLLMGGWTQGVFRNAGYQFSDYMVGPAPQDNGKPAFILNADAFIFWRRKEPEFRAGQQLMAKLIMSQGGAEDVLRHHRLGAGAHRHGPVRSGLLRPAARDRRLSRRPPSRPGRRR